MKSHLPTKYLIDGVDRLGKSTLVNSLLNELGYHLVIHYDKPKALSCYTGDGQDARGIYQELCNENMFRLLKTQVPIIFDRTHLGELVYAPMYRGYSGDYVLKMEQQLIDEKPYTVEDDVCLILLTTSNFDIVTDDGQSFDFSKKDIEQNMFKEAFSRSNLFKITVDVHNGQGGFKSKEQVLNEVLSGIQKEKLPF